MTLQGPPLTPQVSADPPAVDTPTTETPVTVTPAADTPIAETPAAPAPAVAGLSIGVPTATPRTFTPRGAFVPTGVTTAKKKSEPNPKLLVLAIVGIVVLGVGAFIVLQRSGSDVGTKAAAASPFEEIAPPIVDGEPIDLTKIANDDFTAELPSVPLRELQPAAATGDKIVTTWVARAGSNDLIVLRVVTMPPDSIPVMPQLLAAAADDAVSALGNDFFAQTVTQYRGVKAFQILGRVQDQWVHKAVFVKGTSVYTLTATSSTKAIPAAFADVLESMRFATDPPPVEEGADDGAPSDESIPEITLLP